MREYKFRGKRVDNGEWVYGEDYAKIKHCVYIKNKRVDPETVGQYTGLKDEKEADICEGDLFNHGISVGEIKYQGCGFYIDWHTPVEWGKSNRLDILHDEGEVLGNIHDPHLLNLPRESEEQ